MSKLQNFPTILAIDTSCDDTAAAVTCGRTVLSNIISSQTELHRPYGGVFPTVAKQAHKENIAPVVRLALKRARLTWSDISAIAVTQGPGLAPALEVGISYAKELAVEHDLPLIPVNHMEGHLLSPLAQPRKKATTPTTDTGNSVPQFPTLGIIVSGGHTMFVLVQSFGNYLVLGETVDDAAGECLDKVGRMLNLGYPAGPVVEEFAKHGNPHRIVFPLPMTTTRDFNLSFSGLKTFARNHLPEQLTQQETFDWCASLQHGVFRHICHKLDKVLSAAAVGTLQNHLSPKTAPLEPSIAETLNQPLFFSEIWLGGGVAANATLRRMIRQTLRKWHTSLHKKNNSGIGIHVQKSEKSTTVFIPPLHAPYTKRLCQDNAAMIGVAAGLQRKPADPVTVERKPRMAI